MPKFKLKLQIKPKNNWLTVDIKICSRNKRLLKMITQKFKNTILSAYYKKYEKKLMIAAKKLNNNKKLKDYKNHVENNQ